MRFQKNITNVFAIFIFICLGIVVFKYFGPVWLVGIIALSLSARYGFYYYTHGYTAPIPPAPEDVYRIACVGDSITYGTFVNDRAKNCYPNQLENMLGFGYAVRNFGVNGHTMLKSADLPYWRHRNFRKSQDFAPNLVLIMLGTNDSKSRNWTNTERFIADYREFVQVYRNLPTKPRVYVLTPATSHFLKGHKELNYDMNNTAMDQISDAMKRMAVEDDVPLIDIRGVTSARPDCFPFDGVHTNAAGATLIAETVYTTLVNQGVLNTNGKV